MSTVRVALDWTANTNHTPIYVALTNGYYTEAGLRVEIITPDCDDYTVSPAAKLARGDVDIAMCPSESIISYRLNPHGVPLRAVAAMLDRDASSVAVLASSGITRPKELDGKTYASYDARFEDGTIRALVRADGGEGNLRIVQQPRLAIWDYTTGGDADATWIFTAWEGLLAKQKGVDITSFSLTEHGIPYGYSPVLAINENNFDADLVKRFLKATAKGAEFLVHETAAAVRIMEKEVAENEKGIVGESLNTLVSGGYYRAPWGVMDSERWQAWVGWLHSENLLEEEMDAKHLFTNDLLR